MTILCPRSSYLFYIVTSPTKWVTTFWTYSNWNRSCMNMQAIPGLDARAWCRRSPRRGGRTPTPFWSPHQPAASTGCPAFIEVLNTRTPNSISSSNETIPGTYTRLSIRDCINKIDTLSSRWRQVQTRKWFNCNMVVYGQCVLVLPCKAEGIWAWRRVGFVARASERELRGGTTTRQPTPCTELRRMSYYWFTSVTHVDNKTLIRLAALIHKISI